MQNKTKVLVLLGLLLQFVGTRISANDKPKPIWAVDLSSAKEIEESGPLDPNTDVFVTFIDQTRIAVGLLFQIRIDAHQPGRPDNWKSHTLVLIVDAGSGKVLRSRSWEEFRGRPAAAEGFQMRPANSSEFLAMIGNDVVRLSSELDILARRTLPRTAQEKHALTYYDDWELVVSPGGDSALLVHRKLDGSAENHWISTKDLSDLTVTAAPDHFSWSNALADSTIVYNVAQRDLHRLLPWKQKGDGVVMPLCSSCQGRVLGAFGRNLIFLAYDSASYTIVDTSGKEIYNRHGSGVEGIGQLSGSSRANRAAFSYGSLRRSLFHGWHSADHIIVVDADAKREVARIDSSDEGKEIGNWQLFNQLLLAMSPDGRRLAIMKGINLQLLAIP